MMQKLGRYPVLEEIGQGGFSTVYRGLDPLLDREVALKVMHPLLLSDPGFTQRFRREARALAALRHPQIIVIYEVAEADGRLFIVMELAHGPSLAKYIADQSQVSWSGVMAILKPVSQALDYAHRQGVIHRDLKPSNILLDGERGALLSDFGLARILTGAGAAMSTTTTTGAGILGTPSYIAPELWEFESSGPQSDIYSLGCIIFEMLTGKLLFNGQTPVQILRAHDRGPQFPAQWPQGVPSGVEDVLRKALAREPQDRYGDALSMFTDLEDLEATARSAQERARQTSAAGQWRSEALAAMQAAEWGAARMLVGRWLAVSPGDPDALAARVEIDRRQGEGPNPLGLPSLNLDAEPDMLRRGVRPSAPAEKEIPLKPTLIPESGAAAVSTASNSGSPTAIPRLEPLTWMMVFAALIPAFGLMSLAIDNLWTAFSGLMILSGIGYLVLLALALLPIPSLIHNLPKLYLAMMGFIALTIAFNLLLFIPSYDESEFAVPLIRITVVQGVLFLLLLLGLPSARKRATAANREASLPAAANGPEPGKKLIDLPSALQIGGREMWMIVLVLIIIVTWLSIREWFWVLPDDRIPAWVMRTMVGLLAVYLLPIPLLNRLRPVVRAALMILLLFSALIWPLAFFEDYGGKVEYWGFISGRLAELALFGMLLTTRKRDDRITAAAGNSSAPG